jgi:ribosomal protein L11 methyltransferase
VTSGRWTSVRIHAPSHKPAVITALFALGAEGVQEIDADILTHIRNLDQTRAESLLKGAAGGSHVEFFPTPDVDWSAEWRKRITSHRVGRLVVTPPWLADQHPLASRVVIDPGMAFGTGEHETTRGVLRLMQSILQPGDLVADLGAGSAVLAIAAAKLGAQRVVAIESDPDAIGNAEANIQANGVARQVSVIEGDALMLLPLLAPIRVVFANIISSVLLSLLPTLRDSLARDGTAILSGILTSEQAEMESALDRGGWRIVETDREGSWWSVAIARA